MGLLWLEWPSVALTCAASRKCALVDLAPLDPGSCLPHRCAPKPTRPTALFRESGRAGFRSVVQRRITALLHRPPKPERRTSIRNPAKSQRAQLYVADRDAHFKPSGDDPRVAPSPLFDAPQAWRTYPERSEGQTPFVPTCSGSHRRADIVTRRAVAQRRTPQALTRSSTGAWVFFTLKQTWRPPACLIPSKFRGEIGCFGAPEGPIFRPISFLFKCSKDSGGNSFFDSMACATKKHFWGR